MFVQLLHFLYCKKIMYILSFSYLLVLKKGFSYLLKIENCLFNARYINIYIGV